MSRCYFYTRSHVLRERSDCAKGALTGVRREEPREITGFFDHGARGHAHIFAELIPKDEGEGRLTETGRTGEQNVIESIAALASGTDHDLQSLNRFRLACEISKRQRPQRGFSRRDRRSESGGDETHSGRR